jgi:acetyl-CoA carboxylase biotin carboxyl carrier protein
VTVQLSDAHLTALCTAVTRLLDGGMPAPTRLRVSLDGAAVELEWRGGGVERYDGGASSRRGGGAFSRRGGGASSRRGGGSEVPLARPPDEPAQRDDEAAPEGTGFHICAPMIGTFYRAAQPGADPFVDVGDVVSPGQQVGVLEVMKLFTPVEADRAGRVVEILVADGTSVEYGQRLIALDQPDQA